MNRKTEADESPKIAVMGVFANLDRVYSVAGIVTDQLKLLTDEGHKLVFLTTTDFRDQELIPVGVEVRTYPRFTGAVPFPEDNLDAFNVYVAETGVILAELLKDCSICITHDVMFLLDYLPINWALRTAAESLPDLRFLHWIHSAPFARAKEIEYPITGFYQPLKNSQYVYLNRTDVSRLAEMVGVAEGLVRLVHNPIDLCAYKNVHPLAQEILEKIDYFMADTICIYPIRLNPAKQADKVIKLVAALKQHGQSVRLIVCNSYNSLAWKKNVDPDEKYLSELKETGEKWGLTETELIFTSKFESQWAKEANHNMELGLPREAISGLMAASDLFVLPSLTEACSLIMLEAAISKNLVVLNEDLESLHEFGGLKNEPTGSRRAVYIPFGNLYRPIEQYNPSEPEWYVEYARVLIDMQSRDKAVQFFKYVRKRHHPKWIYQHQIQPLLGDK